MTTQKEPVKARLNPRLIAALDVFRARNDVRFYLTGIFVQPLETGGVFMCATNGHVVFAAIDKAGYANREFILETNRAMIATCTKKAVKNDIFSGTECVEIVDDLVFAVKNGGYESGSFADTPIGEFARKHINGAWGFNEIDGKFPDISSAFARAKACEKESTGFIVGINATYMAMFEKAGFILNYGKSRHARAGICIKTNGPSGLIIVRPDIMLNSDVRVIGGIMPMHHDKKEHDFYFDAFMRGDKFEETK